MSVQAFKTREELMAALDAEIPNLQGQVKIAVELKQANPAMSFGAAYVTAGDIQSAERATEAVRAGMPPEKALVLVGSYARFQWAVENLPRATLLRRLVNLWVWSDPDDTRPEYLALWKETYARKGKYIADGRALPRGNVLTVYRGQLEGATVGIAWSLNKGTARDFALTGGTRDKMEGGVIYRARVNRKDVLAYFTGRNEAEVIIDPAGLRYVIVR